jgi:hypothetical protein
MDREDAADDSVRRENSDQRSATRDQESGTDALECGGWPPLYDLNLIAQQPPATQPLWKLLQSSQQQFKAALFRQQKQFQRAWFHAGPPLAGSGWKQVRRR